MQKIIPHLWFDKEAQEASKFYMSLFENSKFKDKTILNNTPSGTIEMITIELEGQEFMLLSAGPYFKFTPAVSFLIACSSVEEVEKIWEQLIENGAVLMPLDTYPFSERYGWASDRYGLSWQITPSIMNNMMKSEDEKKLEQVTEAFIKMKKSDIAELIKAYEK